MTERLRPGDGRTAPEGARLTRRDFVARAGTALAGASTLGLLDGPRGPPRASPERTNSTPRYSPPGSIACSNSSRRRPASAHRSHRGSPCSVRPSSAVNSTRMPTMTDRARRAARRIVSVAAFDNPAIQLEEFFFGEPRQIDRDGCHFRVDRCLRRGKGATEAACVLPACCWRCSRRARTH
jgi:hypothetical protein